MIKLNDKTVQLIKSDKKLFIKVQAALGITEKTMYNYLNENSENLTKLTCIDELVSYTGLPLSELTNSGKPNRLMAK